MFRTFCLILALSASVSADTTTQNKPAQKRHRSVTASHAKKTPSSKAATAGAARKKTSSGKAVTASAKTKGKKARRVPRSTQQAPTPDRYREIQESLASKGYFKGEANGQWGPDSEDALKRFQTEQNLTPDGKLNSLSLIALGLGPKRLTAQSAPKPAAETAK